LEKPTYRSVNYPADNFVFNQLFSDWGVEAIS
jgi:hypothetical protein